MTEWEQDCKRWRGVVLDGRFAHWCNEWDGLPVDETTEEFMCCSCEWDPPEEREAFKAAKEAARIRHNAETAEAEPPAGPSAASNRGDAKGTK